MANIKIDYRNRQIIVSKTFYQKAERYGSDEAKTLRDIQRDYPKMRVMVRGAKKQTNREGEVSYGNQYKNLTYANMERFMNALPNADDYIQVYELAKRVGATNASPYAVVRRWFKKQFPLYKSDPVFYVFHQPELVDFNEFVVEDEQKTA